MEVYNLMKITAVKLQYVFLSFLHEWNSSETLSIRTQKEKKMFKKKTFKKLFITMIILTLLFCFPTMSSAASIKLSKEKITLYAGTSTNLTINSTFKNTVWTSSDTKIVTVKKISKNKVKVLAKEKGTATITARVNGKSYKCRVKVYYKKINQKIKLDLHNIGIMKGSYIGEIKNGKPHGTGKFTSTNSDGEKWYYNGSWINGQMEGKGATYWPDANQIEEGLYVDNEFVKGKLYLDGDLFYNGEFKDDIRDGEGTLYNKKGEIIYTGTVRNDIPTDNEQIIKNSKRISYNELARYENKYLYDLISWTGKVLQVIEGENGYVEYRISEGSNYGNVIYCYYTRSTDEARILEGDYITVYGLSDGLYTYESVSSGYITIPSMEIYYIDSKNAGHIL